MEKFFFHKQKIDKNPSVLLYKNRITNSNKRLVSFTGRSSGAFVGGILISRFGTRETFKILAYAALLFGTCYWLTDVLVLKRIESKRIQRKFFPVTFYYLL